MSKEDIDKARKNARLQVLGDLAWMASHPQGKRILSRFFIEARRRAFTGQSNTSFYAEGRIDLARDLLDDLRAADLALYQAAERESIHEETKHA